MVSSHFTDGDGDNDSGSGGGGDCCASESNVTHRLSAAAAAATTGTSATAAVFLVVNAALGAGLLNFPRAYHEAGGVVAALSVQAVLLVFIGAALVALAACADRSSSATYQATVHGLLGARALYVCSATVAVYCFGTCVTFLIIIRDQLDVILASLVGARFCRTWYMNGAFTMPCTSALLILPLCYSRRIDFLKYSSMVGVAAIVYLDGLIVYQYWAGHFTPGPVKVAPDTWTDVLLVMPTICFGYQCHVSAVPIYACLRRRSVRQFVRVVLTALALCVLTYSTAGTFGYLTFGARVSSDVLVAYDARQPAVLVGVVALVLKTVTTYPLLLFCGREAVDTLWQAWLSAGAQEEAGGGSTAAAAAAAAVPLADDAGVDTVPTAAEGAAAARFSLLRRVLISSVWFAVTVALAAALPNIGVVIQFLGVLAALFIFCFPGLCLMALVLLGQAWPQTAARRAKLALAVVLVAVGAFVFGVVLSQIVLNGLEHRSTAVVSLCHVDSLLSHRPLLV